MTQSSSPLSVPFGGANTPDSAAAVTGGRFDDGHGDATLWAPTEVGYRARRPSIRSVVERDNRRYRGNRARRSPVCRRTCVCTLCFLYRVRPVARTHNGRGSYGGSTRIRGDNNVPTARAVTWNGLVRRRRTCAHGTTRRPPTTIETALRKPFPSDRREIIPVSRTRISVDIQTLKSSFPAQKTTALEEKLSEKRSAVAGKNEILHPWTTR